MEQRGFATVAIGLVRYQMEQVRPPRALWTPFQLGRPLGEPENVAFQRRVLMQALRLLERVDGPVILEDFPEDPPGWSELFGWTPPIQARKPKAALPGELIERFESELLQIRPFWDRAQIRYGRTTVGLSGQEPMAWPAFAATIMREELPLVQSHQTTALALRFMCDDIKAMYSEAAQADGPAPSSRQIDRWFWTSTIAGQLLYTLRTVGMASSNSALRTVSGRFFVPTPYLQDPALFP